MTGRSLDGVALDHVAHAVDTWQDAWGLYAGDLGAEWASGGEGRGFAPAQLRWANGARTELLMPWDTAENDFLIRFLHRSGPGPHHLTFKVPDIRVAIEQARTFGFEPIGIDLSQPEWMEAFLHPSQATGIVVQLAEAPESWGNEPPEDYPADRRIRQDGGGTVPPASLLRVVHAASRLDEALRLFEGLLGGRRSAEGATDTVFWVDLTWDGPLTIRLIAPEPLSEGTFGEPALTSLLSPLDRWIGGRSGRLHHLEFRVAEPETVSRTQPVPPESFALLAGEEGNPTPVRMVEPPDNHGLGLVLRGVDHERHPVPRSGAPQPAR